MGWALAALLQPALARSEDFTGTARLQLQRIVSYEGEDKGPGRAALEGLVEVCNNIRAQFYELPAQHIADGVLSAVDRQRVEHYFSNDRAVTYVTGTLLELPDLNRWQEAAANSADGKVERPPDCAGYVAHEHRTGTLWRDGVVWRLDFTARRAVGTRRAADFTRQPLPLPAPFDTFPKELIAGKTCRVVPMPTAGFMDGESCLWTAFPAARFLGLPWPLRARTRLGMLKKMVTEDKAQFAERNGVLEPGLFDIPVGFTRVGPTP